MATGPALQKVRRLQARLAVHSDPKKLRKYLSELSALPMTPDILAETRVRKTVKGFRKHLLVGTFARDLAAQWKKLARGKSSFLPTPQHWAPNREEPDDDDNDQKQREEEEEEEEQVEEKEEKGEQDAHGGFWKPWPACEGQSHSPAHRRKRPRMLWTLEPHTPSQMAVDQESDHDDQVQAKRQARGARACFPAQHFCESPTHQLWADSADLMMALEPCTVQQEDREPAGGCHAPAQGPAQAQSLPQPQRPEDPEKAAASPNQKPAMFPRQDACPPRASTPEAPSPRIASRHKPQPPAAHSAQAGPPKDTQHPATKLLQSAAAKPLDPQDAATKEPPMTFEQYMTYDYNYNNKKRRKARTTWKVLQSRKASASQQPGKTAKQDSASTRQQVPSAPQCPRLKESQAENLQPAAAGGLAQLGTTPTHARPGTQDSPHALQLLPCFPPATEAPSSPQPEENVGFTGQRINTRMPVYSGATYCTSTMTPDPDPDPDPQCSLAPKHIHSLSRTTAGVPCHVLQPTLHKLTPQQLLHAEKANPQLVPETDAFWKTHCQREFKEEKPQEWESWREMYLRLRDAREQRLQRVTTAIVAAQVNKQKGRQAKMIFFPAAPSSTQAPACHSSHSSSFSPAPGRRTPAARANAPSSLGATKPTTKNPAPLMAKAIQDLKKICSRR